MLCIFLCHWQLADPSQGQSNASGKEKANSEAINLVEAKAWQLATDNTSVNE